jgi:hypothetical protein
MRSTILNPSFGRLVRVWLADGTKMLAMWTGERWWNTKGEITPARWALEERKRKTKELRKALRRSEGGEA